MPSTPQRGFIVRPTQDNTEPEAEPEFESLNIQACTDHYSFTSDTVEDCIKDKMLEKIKEFLENNQLNELSVLVTVYQKFKELHP